MELTELLIILGILALISLPVVIIAMKFGYSSGEKEWKAWQSEEWFETKAGKAEVILEMMDTFEKEIMSRYYRNPSLLAPWPTSLVDNPLEPTEHKILLRTYLSGSRWGRSANTEVLEPILRKLLQDDYDMYWSLAKKQVIAKGPERAEEFKKRLEELKKLSGKQ